MRIKEHLLSYYIADLYKSPLSELNDLRRGAVEYANRHFGYDKVSQKPSVINLAALALKMRHNMVVHRLKPEVVQLVKETEVAFTPKRVPPLLQQAGIIEVSSPGETLYHTVTSIGWYCLDGVYFILQTSTVEGSMEMSHWTPDFAGEEIDAEVTHKHTVWTEGIESGRLNIAKQHSIDAPRFLCTLGLILEAEKTPLYEKAPPKIEKQTLTEGKKRSDSWWRYKTFYATKHPIRHLPAEHTPSEEERKREGLVLETVRVRPHIRRNQHYGPKNSLVKDIFIDAYDADRWVKSEERPTRITVV